MKHYFFVLILMLTVFSCKENNTTNINNNSTTEHRFEGDYFSFDYPEDWEITDNEFIEQGVYYVSVEKKGFDSSGLITIVSFDDIMDLDELIQFNIEELQSNPLLNKLKFEPISDNTFNSTTSRASSFTFSALGTKHEGLISALSSTSNSYVIVKQEAIEDNSKNANGFSIIENSFNIK